MASVGIFSKEERSFITGGIEFDIRTDGRSYTDYRHFTIKTGVISSANGSSEVKLVRTISFPCILELFELAFMRVLVE